MRRTTRSADGTLLAYRVHGDAAHDAVQGNAPTVVLVHGWMASSAVFEELLTAFPPHGVRLLSLDLRGAGASQPARDGYSLERYAEDVQAVLDAEHVARAVLVGHSMGGQLAQFVAATRPERVGGLFCVLPVPADGLALPESARAAFRGAGGKREALEHILGMASPGLTSAVRERLVSDALGLSPQCVAESFDAWTKGGFADRLEKVRAPTLVVASDDAFLPVELLDARVVRRIAGAQLAHVEGAGHYLPNERPQELAALLQAFLAGLDL